MFKVTLLALVLAASYATIKDKTLITPEAVSPANMPKTRNREIDCYDNRIALKFGWYLGSGTAGEPV